MSNDFFNATGVPSSGSAVQSAPVRTELASVAAGFDKMPTLSGNGGKLVHVNAGATALEAGSITSAQIAASVSDETGTGSLVFSTSPTLITPALGTPSALVGTNITGTAAGLSIGGNAATATLASTVTTNANLTGVVTSTGNATAIADAALSIAKTSGLQAALDAKAELAGSASQAFSVSTLSAATTIGVGGATPAASGAGITFPATQSASSDANTLDDYEEGTWTPSDASGAALSFTINVTAKYLKIGSIVIAEFDISYPATANGSNSRIGGLPFTPSGSSGQGYIAYTTESTAASLWGAGIATSVYPYTTNGNNITNATLSTDRIVGVIIYTT